MFDLHRYIIAHVQISVYQWTKSKMNTEVFFAFFVLLLLFFLFIVFLFLLFLASVSWLVFFCNEWVC